MSENGDPDRGGRPGRIDEKVLGSWIREVADETGMTEQEVLDRMLSAYWLIDEFEDPSRDDAIDRSKPLGFGSDLPDLGADSLTPGVSRFGNDEPDPSEPEGDRQGEPDPELAQLSAKIDRIVELLADEADEESDDERTDAKLDTLDDRLDALDDRTGALADTVDRLRNYVEEIDREAPDAGTVERLQDAVPEVAREVQQLREDQDTLRSEVSEDFGHIERILRHLLDRTDELERSLERARSHGEDRERSRVDERLTKLKRTASAEGIRSAECDECDGSVDLGVLPEPRCPHCGAEFISLEPRSWLFGSNTLSVRRSRNPDPREPLHPDRGNSAEAAENAALTDESTRTGPPDDPAAVDEGDDSAEPADRTGEAGERSSGIASEIDLSDDIRPTGDRSSDTDGDRADIEDGTETGSGTHADANEDDGEEAAGEGFDWDR
ncbi:hypothetical protein [Halobaculum magnesiiphilum]|uniref:Uncharacterized protein n=1 Tax=Halobaculum magnesiiphilum TaxID=1017351 RepID=A0A8T8WEB5_9EURY|nr:hypothetical protein [Halobaculum magnesiiphilum]QZP38126.1 hypothetical protein K6T50_02895 [Halobaculum magnesiiphilum]